MAASDDRADSAWLLFQFQLPRGKSSGRVAVWRRLRRLGALGLGGATYALPDDAESRESFEWLRRDVEELGGEALLFAARPADGRDEAALERRRRGEAAAEAPRRAALEPLDPARFRRRTWVTRPRPGVDRMASAWLVRKFIDPAARFVFADDPARQAPKAIPFDTYGAELGHQQGLCTFEVLARRFAIDDPAVAALGRTVHAVDLHEEAADPAEAAMMERLVAGLRASHADDGELLAAGMAVFEALCAAHGASRPGNPRARSKKKRGQGRKR